ncbi:hypothetical protein N7493_001287 [Penicillium malachiteum]|uniref:Major facilitator superfamily (MFS) profile domain-containing protein n=1 Tax=Penicillium malachiteum TaxID=1324776 RepID=A0AAD6HUF0_9EURO|nr:hypothetical protein N7493_001287 [Penicillium malachiteum]
METSLESAATGVTEQDNKGSVVTNLSEDSEDRQANTTTVSTGDTRPYSAFTNRQKWSLCALASLAAIFGPISSNIFVPAIPQVGTSFGISTQKVDLALTIYLVFQALSPSFFSGLSDTVGRRPVLMFCLMMYCIACVAIALTPHNAYWMLLLLRCLQATGGSPALGTGSGAMGDIATPAERGTYMGLFTGAAMIGPSFGPVLGGILVEYLSWRWIFWVLAILCIVNLSVIFVLMPETLRSIVGDGSLRPPFINAKPIDWIRKKRAHSADPEKVEEVDAAALATKTTKPKYNPLVSFRMIFYPEVFLIEVFGSIFFGVFFGVLTVYSTVLADDYGYDDVKIGLCYLSQGAGALLSGVMGGRLIDWQFRRMKVALNFQPKHHRDIEGFPIETARFKFLPYYLPVYIASILGFAWSLQYRANIAISIVMSFIIGALSQFNTQCCSVCLIDMVPMRSGAAVASYNFFRCAISALISAIITPMTKAMGLGWTFVVLCGALLLSSPGMWVIRHKGEGWRAQRKQQFGTGHH